MDDVIVEPSPALRTSSLGAIFCVAAMMACSAAGSVAAVPEQASLSLECKGEWNGKAWSEAIDVNFGNSSFMIHSVGEWWPLKSYDENRIVFHNARFDRAGGAILLTRLSRLTGEYRSVWGNPGSLNKIEGTCQKRAGAKVKPKL